MSTTPKQVLAVTQLNLRSLPKRVGASSVIVIGIAGVVGVLVSILAMKAGLSQMMSSHDRPDRAIVISTGSSFEVRSMNSRASGLSESAIRTSSAFTPPSSSLSAPDTGRAC